MRGLETPEEASKGGNINIVAAKGAGICEVVLSNGKVQRTMLLPFGKGFMWVESGGASNTLGILDWRRRSVLPID